MRVLASSKFIKIRNRIIMRNYSLVLAMAFSLGAVTHAAAGDITGRVLFKGTPPKEVGVNMATDPKCGALHTEPVFTRFYVTEDGGLGDVLVYIKDGLEKKDWPIPTEKVVLDQKGCEYVPYVLGVRAGQTVAIRNSDPTLHNVHATPKLNKEFNFAQPVQGMVTEKVFDKPEVPVRFKCDVHGWMFAYVGVFDHPFFAVTDSKGNFKISGVPNGKYTLVAYHRKTHNTEEGLAQELAVDGDAKVEFTVEVK
jgi:plastocyanin